jgi:hypothetical protein
MELVLGALLVGKVATGRSVKGLFLVDFPLSARTVFPLVSRMTSVGHVVVVAEAR